MLIIYKNNLLKKNIIVSKNKGFTLIELLVVIAIIGILAGMVLVSMGGARAKARDAKRMSDMRQLRLAQEMYTGDNSGNFFIDSAMPSGADLSPYLNPVPADPLGTGSYTYKTINNTGFGSYFCYWATLEGGGYFAASQGGTVKKSTQPAASSPIVVANFTACATPN